MGKNKSAHVRFDESGSVVAAWFSYQRYPFGRPVDKSITPYRYLGPAIYLERRRLRAIEG